MPRMPRGEGLGHIAHVLSRGNARATVFHGDGDYRAFLALLARAKARFAVQIFAFCLMPNHFHLVAQPSPDSTLSAFMQWWLTSHVRRYHRQYGSSGHVWQGRFKSFPIQQDAHLLTVMRYVLWNPLRAELAGSVRDWPWTSLHYPELTDAPPITLPTEWNRWLDEPLTEPELRALRGCVARHRPFGTSAWQATVADAAGLQATLRPRGRPRKGGSGTGNSSLGDSEM